MGRKPKVLLLIFIFGNFETVSAVEETQELQQTNFHPAISNQDLLVHSELPRLPGCKAFNLAKIVANPFLLDPNRLLPTSPMI
jgi:hypothetical protein